MTDAHATVAFCLNKYGPRVTLEEALEIVKRGRTKFREGIKAGRYPEPVERGLWSTEALALAAAGVEQMESEDDGI